MKALKLKYILFLLSTFAILVNQQCTSSKSNEVPLEDVIKSGLEFSVEQSLKMAESLEDLPGRLPKTVTTNGKLETCDPAWWVSGFFPGQLWYMYEFSGREDLRQLAHDFSMRVKDQQYTTDNHDVGFIIFCSFGNGYRLTSDSSYLDVIQNASTSLITRFNSTVGCIRSWDYAKWSKQWQYPVIIDNMMNLELLLWAAHEYDADTFSQVAVSHANNTIQNHFRPDHSSYHVVSYDTLSGQAELKHTAQGYSHESSWARGQAWGLYGFTIMYRFTADSLYLHQAQDIADFIIRHPNLPEDKIPYWDFDAPDIPDAKRDASAGAIISSALIELSGYVSTEKAKEYIEVAEEQIRNLTASYRNSPDENANFILKHSVGHMPNNSEVDVPLSYADYYYVEALMRMKNLLDN